MDVFKDQARFMRACGKLRSDDKILKPDGWKSPQEELARLIRISDFLG